MVSDENMSQDDITIECVECKEMFVFTSGEQAFYASKGFPNPKRCKDCRAARKDVRINPKK